MVQTVREFIDDTYRLISADSPTVPLHGNDMAKGIQYMNERIRAYSGTGSLLTVAKQVAFTLVANTSEVTFADPGFLPPADIQEGRLANMQNAWIELTGVTYPLIDESRNTFFSAYKYEPLAGLPRFAIILPETNITRMRIYPKPSQEYELFVYGKFELTQLTANDDMSILPEYYIRFLRFAVAKDIALYKGREQAWTPPLEQELVAAREDMRAVSSYNLNIESDEESLLNGRWRVQAGI